MAELVTDDRVARLGELRPWCSAANTTDEAVSVGYFMGEEAAAMDVMANHIEQIRDAFAYEGSGTLGRRWR